MFPLARPHISNEFQAVNIYLDEAGQLKGLPLNKRASGIAELCGYRGVQFAGNKQQQQQQLLLLLRH